MPKAQGNGLNVAARDDDFSETDKIDLEISRLAKLREVDYEKARKDAASKLGMRASILDKLVAAERPDSTPGNGRPLELATPEPWPEPGLVITAPEKRCGKTTLLDVIALLVLKALASANISAAATMKAARWVADNAGAIRVCDPAIPEAIFNRAADNWEPLLAVAEVAGGDLLARARQAALAACGIEEEPSYGAMLLADIRCVFRRTAAV